MGLKFSDALHLSWKNLFQHKKRSLTVIITISVLFSTVLIYSLFTSGIKKTAISASMNQTNNKIYIKVNSRENDFRKEKFISTKEEIPNLDLRPIKNQNTINDISRRVRIYDSKIIGFHWYYQIDFPYQVIDKSIAEDFIDPSLWNKIPEGKIPVITIDEWKLSNPKEHVDLKNNLYNTIFKVGRLPKLNKKEALSNNVTVLTPILQNLPESFIDSSIWFIDDGTGKVEDFIRQQIAIYLSEDENRKSFLFTQPEASPVISFSNPKNAVKFISPNKKTLGLNNYSEEKYSYEDLFGTTLNIINSFNSMQFLYIFSILLLLVITIIVTTVTFFHVIDEDTPVIALYRAMGATAKSIYLIYFLYLLELCLLALLAIILTVFITITFTYILFTETLSTTLAKFYNLSQAPKIFFIAENIIIPIVLIIIPLIAPISLLFSIRQFSSKNIAKRLKED